MAETFLADLHVHSYHSLATSRECCLEGLQRGAQLKGVALVATGDCTHPGWLAELMEKLEPAAPGLFRLRPELAAVVDAEVPPSCRAPVQFMLSTEISSIWKQDGRTRKVHSLIYFPELAAAAAMSERLGKHAKIENNGRPTTHLTPRELLAMALECHPASLLIPAHIWTPWFSLFGANSGFDRLEDCFGDLSGEICAVETGLSSDPPMNWRWSALDRLVLVSNSDLHSPGGLARNATRFRGEPDYYRLRNGLRAKDPAVCAGTLDMFPEEGKYHHDGHRKCGVVLTPEEAIATKNLCPVCGKPLTFGVLHRIAELADRPVGTVPANALPCEHILPLQELLAESLQLKPVSPKVAAMQAELLRRFGNEDFILRRLDSAELDRCGRQNLARAIRNVRAGQVRRQPGYDGVYGEIKAL